MHRRGPKAQQREGVLVGQLPFAIERNELGHTQKFLQTDAESKDEKNHNNLPRTLLYLLHDLAHGQAMDAAARVEDLRAALAQNRLQIRACKQRARRHERAGQHGGLSCLEVRKVLAVYALSSWRLDAAVLAAKQLAGMTEAPTQEFIRGIFREHNLEDLLHMHDETHRAWSAARAFAKRFLLEHDTWSWVKRMNVAQGVAPSAASVFHLYESRLHAVPPPGQPRKRTVNKWVARWRDRWGVRKARLRVADQMQPEVLQQKAGSEKA